MVYGQRLAVCWRSKGRIGGGESTSPPRPRGEDTGPGPCLASSVSIRLGGASWR
ncbi:unnamed protein product [Ectocarpus sp. 12 AP-2014]